MARAAFLNHDAVPPQIRARFGAEYGFQFLGIQAVRNAAEVHHAETCARESRPRENLITPWSLTKANSATRQTAIRSAAVCPLRAQLLLTASNSCYRWFHSRFFGIDLHLLPHQSDSCVTTCAMTAKGDYMNQLLK